MDVILFGPPGAGRALQAAAICNALSIPHISTGDIFRKHLKEGTDLGELAKSYMNKGQLVPDSVVCDIVPRASSRQTALAGPCSTASHGRSYKQRCCRTWLETQGRVVGAVINLEVDDAVLVSRSAQRTSDLYELWCDPYHVANNPHRSGDVRPLRRPVVQRKDDSGKPCVPGWRLMLTARRLWWHG